MGWFWHWILLQRPISFPNMMGQFLGTSGRRNRGIRLPGLYNKEPTILPSPPFSLSPPPPPPPPPPTFEKILRTEQEFPPTPPGSPSSSVLRMDVAFPLDPTGFEALLDLPRTTRRSVVFNVIWSPMFSSAVTEDDLRNRFLVDANIQNRQAVSLSMSFGVTGGESVEEVCGTIFDKLRESGRLGPNPCSAVFYTVEEKPLLIPSGTLMAELFKTHQSASGVSLELSCSIVPMKTGERFIITPPKEDAIFGAWMVGFLSQ